MTDLPLTSAHWGTYRVEVRNGVVAGLHDFEHDPDPSPIGHGIVDVLDDPSRISGPMVRQSWLEGGPGTNNHLRGQEPFVAVSWAEAERLVAVELQRVRAEHGNQSIFGGSYGWSSAGRFHHAQSQLHRFLNTIGGYTSSRNTYSFAAAEVMVPHVVGSYRPFVYNGMTWPDIVDNAELVVAFGGVPLKNGQIGQGGVGGHRQLGHVQDAVEAGVRFVNVSPLRSDVLAAAGADWLAPRPGTDVAIMLALAHTLLTDGQYDQDFLDRYTVGFDVFSRYLTGEDDGIVKSARWASEIADVPESTIVELARSMGRSRTVISTSWSLTRQDHGEQPFWAATALAAMLGRIGLPGQGVVFGLSAVNTVGSDGTQLPVATLPIGFNPVKTFIPVARISDMLLEPGSVYSYDGGRYTYPDIKLMWWCGGNPFHHHQDLDRMVRAWHRPDTIIVNEWTWNTNAKYADIVLACTTPLERDDLQITPRDPFLSVMDKAIEPVGEARDDHLIFAGIAAELDRLGGSESAIRRTFTEDRTPAQWLEWLYDRTRDNSRKEGIELPTLDELRKQGWHQVDGPHPVDVWAEFRAGRPLATPSGKIEIFSETVAGFELDDCAGHPTWFEPREWLGAEGTDDMLHLISNQPSTKLHSQLDHGAVSRAAKINGREPVAMHPDAAASRNLTPGSTVRIFNGRGSCLAGLVLDDGLRPDVVQMATGAWYDPAPDPDRPDGPQWCKHGNPNAVSKDEGTSSLAQGPSAQTCLVHIERYDGSELEPTPFEAPVIVRAQDVTG